jgi:cell division protein FtsB
MLWILFSPQTGIWQYYRTQKELQQLQIANEELRTENKAIQEELDKLKKDKTYLEKVAREQLGLIRKNEIIYDFDKKK